MAESEFCFNDSVEWQCEVILVFVLSKHDLFCLSAQDANRSQHHYNVSRGTLNSMTPKNLNVIALLYMYTVLNSANVLKCLKIAVLTLRLSKM